MIADYHYDICSFGAKGDGCTLNTSAIRQAIDHCADKGGGTVVVPPGNFVSGTLYLKSHVHLHLMTGAVLKASSNREDYNDDTAFPQNHVASFEHVSGAHFILGINVSDVVISGSGTIDGSEAAFRGELMQSAQGEAYFGPPEWRPGQMILFCESSELRVEGVRLRNAPYWHLLFHGCTDVQVRGLNIRTDRRTRNGDGIGLDCCVRAVVSDCIIDSSDDCITVRANGKPLLKTAALSERITISNCVFRSRTCGIRIGVGNGLIRNIVVSNVEMTEVKSGIHVQGKYSPQSEGVEIDTIRFNNISINGQVAFHFTAGYEGAKPIRNLFLSNINALSSATSYLGGSPLQALEECTFDNVDIIFTGGEINQPSQPSPYELYRDAGAYAARAIGMPYGIYLEYARNLRFRRVTIRWQDVRGLWQESIAQHEAERITFHDCDIATPPALDGSREQNSSKAE